MSNPLQPVQNTLAGETRSERLAAGAVAGLAGGIVMGLVLQLGTDLLPVIGGLTGGASAVRGWLVHLAVSVAYGIAFPVILSFPYIRDMADSVGASILFGVIHASALGFITVGVVLQAATVIFGLSGSPLSTVLVPGPSAGSLVPAGVFGLSHLLYGIVLGTLYGVIRGFGSG